MMLLCPMVCSPFLISNLKDKLSFSYLKTSNPFFRFHFLYKYFLIIFETSLISFLVRNYFFLLLESFISFSDYFVFLFGSFCCLYNNTQSSFCQCFSYNIFIYFLFFIFLFKLSDFLLPVLSLYPMT